MFQNEFEAASKAAATKARLLKQNPAAYFLLSMLAGAFIGFGVLLANSIGAQLVGTSAGKLAMGCAFGVALSLVVIAGGELFTGNNFVMTAGALRGQVTLAEAYSLWAVCWLGNLAGAILLGLLYHGTGLGAGDTGAFIASGAAAKMALSPAAMVTRGILCNVLVCLAVWCGFRTKSDAAKLIMIFWCLFAFITTGFEHSIANMTLFTVAMLNPAGQAVSFAGAAGNLLFVTAGNIIGGALLVALPYHTVSK